jgi:tRNA A37 threonylcarbamoyladenosine modification protein TsaB
VAFAVARGINLHPTVSHDAIALSWFMKQGAGDHITDLRVITDARRKEVYWSDYVGIAAGIPLRRTGPAVTKPDDLPPTVGAGPQNTLTATAVSAIQLALVARAEQSSGITRAFQPLYLRSPDVTLSNGPKRVSS